MAIMPHKFETTVSNDIDGGDGVPLREIVSDAELRSKSKADLTNFT